MPLRKALTKFFHRTLYGGQLETITLLKRNDDQQEGTVRSILLYQCRRKMIFKTGEPIAGDMASTHRTNWVIPRIEMDRVGVEHINSADRIVDKFGRVWEPESTTRIDVKLFENYVDIECRRLK